jgi:CheY-like chemotaxis protein
MSQRVLVVDDSPTVRRVVSRTLAQAGYTVTLAADGREALEHLAVETPALVLVDFVMPTMNGLRFVQALRQIRNLQNVPVVLMSAKADKIGEGFLAQTAALDAITKPFSPEALLAVTGNAIARGAAATASESGEALPAPRVGSDPPPGEQIEQPPNEVAETAASSIAEQLTRFVAEGADANSAAALEARLARASSGELFALARSIAALVPGSEGEGALEGRLEHVPLGDVLQVLTQQRQTGVVEIAKQPSRRGRTISVCLRDGSVQLALATEAEAEFQLGRYFVREGLVDREDLERIGRQRGHRRGLLGAHLLRLGYISPDDLQRALIQQTSELIYEALRWRRGRYRFVRFASRPEADEAHLGLPIASILMEGLRRVDEWRLIEEQIPSFDAVPRRDAEALRSVDVMRLSPDERGVLESVDGERTVREIVEQVRMSSFDAAKVVFQLVTSRLLRMPR